MSRSPFLLVIGAALGAAVVFWWLHEPRSRNLASQRAHTLRASMPAVLTPVI